MVTELDVGDKTKNTNVKQPINDNKRMKTPIKDGETKENMQMKNILAEMSIMKKDFMKELSTMRSEISNMKLQLKD